MTSCPLESRLADGVLAPDEVYVDRRAARPVIALLLLPAAALSIGLLCRKRRQPPGRTRSFRRVLD
jgi:hypothetical protein